MINKYKKGDVVVVSYRTEDGKKYSCAGILTDISRLTLGIGHNFISTHPIDVTRIPLREITRVKIVKPNEINSPEDLRG